jgi:hypothetical protein
MTRTEKFSWMIAAACLVALIFLVSPVWQRVQGYDETFYLSGGVNLSSALTTGSAAYAPLYSLWYFILSAFTGNFIFVYYLNWVVQVIVASVVIFLIFKDSGVFAASLLTMAALVCPYYFLWPYVNLFASNVFLIFMLLILRSRAEDYTKKLPILAACFLTLMFIRPEFILTAYIMLVLALVSILYSVGYKKEKVSWRLVACAAALGAVVLIANSMFFDDSSRSALAFVQHYNLRLYVSGEITENPWRSNRALADFGFTEMPGSILAFLRASPERFASHVAANILSAGFLVLLCLFVANVVMAWKRWSSWGADGEKILLLTVIGVYAPAMAGSVLIYPKPAYMMIVYFLNVIVFGRSLLMRRIVQASAMLPWLRIALGVSAFSLAVAAMIAVTIWKVRHPLPDLQEIVACIRSQEPQPGRGSIRVLDALRGVDVYLGPDASEVLETDIMPEESMDDFLNRTRPTFVVVEDRIAEFASLRFGEQALARALTERSFSKACEGALWTVYSSPVAE